MVFFNYRMFFLLETFANTVDFLCVSISCGSEILGKVSSLLICHDELHMPKQ